MCFISLFCSSNFTSTVCRYYRALKPAHAFISLSLLYLLTHDKLWISVGGKHWWHLSVLKCRIHTLTFSCQHLQAVSISVNAWSDAGHAVNHLYDILYMMGRDDILVGVGGDGGISDSGTIYSNVGGYLPMIDQVPASIITAYLAIAT